MSTPDAVVLTGLAGGRSAGTPERGLINVREIEGTEGVAPPITRGMRRGRAHRRGRPGRIFATLPNRAIIEALLSVGIPPEISNPAGTCLCNETLQAGLTSILEVGSPVRKAGFVHVPTATSCRSITWSGRWSSLWRPS